MNEENNGNNTESEKGEEKKKNKITQMAWDYYKTNREITKQYDAEYEKERQEGTNKGRKWTSTEKLYMSAIVIGVILIAIKYLVFR